MNYLNELISILNEMSPYLLLGFLISGFLHVYMPRSLYHRFLHRKGFGSVLGAAVLGVPLPLCSCGVIPTAVSLKKDGATDGATVSFLVATPQTGVDSILATYSLLGPAYAIIRPVAAFVVALFSGAMVDKFGAKSPSIDSSKFTYVPNAAASQSCECGCGHSVHNHQQCGCQGHTHESRKSFGSALRYAFIDLMQDFGKWLVVGLLVAAAITAFIPDSVFAMFKEHYFLNVLLILVISAPMYICATGSVPIALSLIMKGVSPGAAFVLLMAGPATNMASLIILRREIGVRKTMIYLMSIIVGAVVCAVIIDYALPSEWFSGLLDMGVHEHHHHDHDHTSHGPIWWQTTTSVIFVALFLNAMIRKWVSGQKACGCH